MEGELSRDERLFATTAEISLRASLLMLSSPNESTAKNRRIAGCEHPPNATAAVASLHSEVPAALTLLAVPRHASEHRGFSLDSEN